ncbi:hypothetical protein X777_03795 [Ooceraea biroi]|uniref:Uncharacterized protein n=1 Tax=Ooceraea biroi TaxID=2015173 RepID=A0A026WIR2_OOCBI|nr:hypothetical protein X777_03795 [Ooceraea biroi]
METGEDREHRGWVGGREGRRDVRERMENACVGGGGSRNGGSGSEGGLRARALQRARRRAGRRGWLLVKGSTNEGETSESGGSESEAERERVRGREGCWGGSGETEFTPSGIRQFVSDHGARKMLPVVHVTGGPPSSRRRRRATAYPLGAAASIVVPGEPEGNHQHHRARETTAGAGRISRPTSTATMTMMALTVLLVLLVPAAFPDKITIGECRRRPFVRSRVPMIRR